MTEGARAGSVLCTNKSGSERPNNIRIRIQISNTGEHVKTKLILFCMFFKKIPLVRVRLFFGFPIHDISMDPGEWGWKPRRREGARGRQPFRARGESANSDAGGGSPL
jgi:hypothetical protein